MNTPVTQLQEWRQIDANPDQRVTVSPEGNLTVGKRTWRAGQGDRQANSEAINSFRNAMRATGDERSHRYRGIAGLAASQLKQLEDDHSGNQRQGPAVQNQPKPLRQAKDLSTHAVKSVTLKHNMLKQAINNGCKKSRESGGSVAFNFAKFTAWAKQNRRGLEQRLSEAPNDNTPDDVLESKIAELGLAVEEAIVDYLKTAQMDVGRADQLLTGGDNLATLKFDELLHQRQEVREMLQDLGKLDQDDPQRQEYEGRLQELHQKYDQEEQRRDYEIALRRFIDKNHPLTSMDKAELKDNFDKAKKLALMLEIHDRPELLSDRQRTRFNKIIGGYQRELRRREIIKRNDQLGRVLNAGPHIEQGAQIDQERNDQQQMPIEQHPAGDMSIDNLWRYDDDDDDESILPPLLDPIDIDSDVDEDGNKLDK